MMSITSRPDAPVIRALIWDFDGLILDTEGPAFHSWREIYDEYGVILPLSRWATAIGASVEAFDPFAYLEAELGRSLDYEALLARQRRREAELIEAESVLPGVEDYIADAKRLGLKLGLASSSDCEWVHRHLKRLGLSDEFDCIKCADDVERVKPHPDLYLAVLDGLRLAPEEVIALEDSPNGIAAAQGAGIFCVVVPNPLTQRLSTEHADLRLQSLAELRLSELIRQAQGKASAAGV
jgi:HAD superfamily hydrolase (TIGR01509 family)